MGMDLEYVPAPIRPRLHRRMSQEISRRIRGTYRYDTTVWRTAIAGLWIVCFLAFTTAVLGIPTGLGVPTDIALAAGTSTILLAIASNIIAVLIALTGLRIPRLFAGCVLSDLGAILLILYYADFEIEAAVLIAVLLSVLGALGGLAIGLLRSKRITMGLLLTITVTFSQLALANGVQEIPTLEPIDISDSDVIPLTAASPSQPGNQAYQTFTYASGKDLHRTEYGKDTNVISSTVDASAYIKDWSKLRTLFWGFDYNALPLNGRVWMPEGEGPYPVVLMVHGNHMMEDYSDGGYAYLGELLASRGFIAISLDENFLNYSAWSGIPDNDFKVRTWIILKHLEQLAAFSDEPDNPFYQKIDFTKTALLGHSRGGQAVAMAADAERWFKNDPVMKAVDRFNIASVVALAPTDKTIDDQQARLKDVNYLTLQGARDGDVHDFYGDRQYIRTSYSQGSSAFKSSLYIADANHSQFNSDWGAYDQTLPAGLFLNRAQIMDADKQRQIAKVYVSAFLETTLHEKDEYQSLFRDYRSGLKWLPETTYYNRFQDGRYRPVATFDEDRNKNTVNLGSAEASGLSWSEELAKDRESKSKATYGVVLERTAKKDEEAYYNIKLKDSVVTEMALSDADGLTFSLANLNGDIKDEPSIPLPPNVEVELTDKNDTSARLPLSEVMDILPLPQTQFTLFPWLEERINDGKYGDLSEAVFQTYEMPFEQFQEEEPELEPENLTEITFYLEAEGDKIMLDDIGFYDLGIRNMF
ncbi:poly(ethylene terephthalate) hydrolase family protein [Paenibacillus sp. FSL P4-0184]|uniref:poly(ethylene terephthalate) hydrolase family protein n=1 Tax=Paenibacillus sp. FSL P4-0184 TaxID=2921632 RepID=UPI0030F6D9C6